MESSGKRTKFRHALKAQDLYTSKKPEAGPVLKIDIPPVLLQSAVKGWVAVVLSVLHHTGARNIDLLRHSGRTSTKLGEARRLLIWLFMEIASRSGDTLMAEAWLEQCVNIGRRTIKDTLLGEPPPQHLLAAALMTYARLQQELGPEDVHEALQAGVIGAPHDRGRIWRKDFGLRLGLDLVS